MRLISETINESSLIVLHLTVVLFCKIYEANPTEIITVLK